MPFEQTKEQETIATTWLFKKKMHLLTVGRLVVAQTTTAVKEVTGLISDGITNAPQKVTTKKITPR